LRILIRTELFVLRRRPVGAAMLWVCTLLPAVAAVLYGQLSTSEMILNERPVAEMLPFSGPDAAQVALRTLHWLIPLFMLALAGQSWAGERTTHVLREQWVRPISRSAAFWAKTLSLWAIGVVCLFGATLMSLLITTPWLGTDGPWRVLGASVLMSVPTLFGLTLLATCMAQIGRSTASVIVGGLLFLGIDLGLRLGLAALGFMGVGWASALKGFLFGSAVGQWTSAADGLSVAPLLSLLGWAVVLAAVSWRRVQRMDVP